MSGQCFVLQSHLIQEIILFANVCLPNDQNFNQGNEIAVLQKRIKQTKTNK